MPGTTRVLLIEHREADAFLLQRMIAGARSGVIELELAVDFSAGMEILKEQQFDCVVIDLDHPDYDRFEILLQLRNADRSLAIVVLTEDGDEEFGLAAVACGAQDFIARDYVNGQLLCRAIRFGVARQRQIVHFKAAAHTDGLTGLANRRALDLSLQYAMEKFQAEGIPFAFLILDIDKFKTFNDTYGHCAGDLVLSELGSLIKESMSSSDFCARYGGEEFAAVLKDQPPELAASRMDRVLRRIEAHPITLDGVEETVTASAGLTIAMPGDTVATVVQRADSALYQAKSLGRNQGVVCELVRSTLFDGMIS